MPRNAKCRRVCQMPAHCRFSPEQPAHGEAVELTVEEYEAVRLMDYLGLNQEEAAAQMGVARTTVQRIYAQARRKLAAFLVEGRPLQIGGGSYALCPQENCRAAAGPAAGVPPKTERKRHHEIAVTYENGQVFQHFGHTAQFKLYDAENGGVVSSQVVDTNGSGHGALAGFLKDHQVDALICGGIGGGAQMALAEAGIRLYAGCQGDADQRVAELLAGTLVSADGATCDHHHGEHHDCGDHGCGHHEEGHTCGHC